ncbi:hypothetical protein ACOME3_005316 [Neoechinorhynchus agilis]
MTKSVLTKLVALLVIVVGTTSTTDLDHRRLTLFTRFIELVNESLSINQENINKRIVSLYSGQVPDVVIASAMQYVSMADKYELDRSKKFVHETVQTRLNFISKNGFTIQVKNNGLRPILKRVKFKDEALVRLKLSSTKNRRKRRQTPYISEESHRVLPNGCLIKTHVYNFNNPEILDVLAKGDLFKQVGVPIGVYEISYCSMSAETSCQESTSEAMHHATCADNTMPKRSPHFLQKQHSQIQMYYLNHFMQSNVNGRKMYTGCCFPTQYRDVRMQFSSGYIEHISDASATNCGCFYGVNVPCHARNHL